MLSVYKMSLLVLRTKPLINTIMISLNLNASKLLEKITCFSVTTEEMTKMRYKKMPCVKNSEVHNAPSV